MPRVLDITATIDRLTLDRERRGTALFTVTNPGAQDVLGALDLICLDGSAIATTSIQGEAQRTFKPGVTTSVVYAVAVPAHVAAGGYRLRLDVRPADAALGLVRGPEIGLVVPEGGGAVERSAGPRRSLLIVILILIAVLLVGGGVTTALLMGGDDEPPGRDQAVAWLGALQVKDPEALAALGTGPHLFGAEIKPETVLVRSYAAALAQPPLLELADAANAVAGVRRFADVPESERPPAELALGADDAVAVIRSGEPPQPRLRLYLRRAGDRFAIAGYTAVAP